ncbi:MAG: transglycosylase SLT domain-containing protein, partial [Treponema sp.]|nr:transglycosylase SLT domain-containing protein [Treponema sp.]
MAKNFKIPLLFWGVFFCAGLGAQTADSGAPAKAAPADPAPVTALFPAGPGAPVTAAPPEAAGSDSPERGPAVPAEADHPGLPPRPLRSVRERGGFPRNRLPSFGDASGGGPGEFTLLSPEALDRPLTRRYIKQYSSAGGLAWLRAVLDRGAPYLPFIQRRLRERGLPGELAWLPVIESGYLASAVSKSGAAGLWQFMKNSMAPFGMKVTDWADERMDFWKSTEGALGKLEENYKYFGDWALALGAYNAGLGAVSRAWKRNGGDYWTLCDRGILKQETAHYVPKFLAVSYILSNPRRFGLPYRWDEDPRWQQVAVTGQVDLGILAGEAGIDGEELKRANRELRYYVTPPGGWQLPVRGADAERVRKTLDRGDILLLRYYRHVIRSGDTLLALGLHYGVSVETIMAANPGIQPRYLKLGAALLIPALREANPYRRSPEAENLV